jgi:hypothetical protein
MANTNHPLKELLSICSATEYKDFIFELITELVQTGYFEGMTEKGRNEFVPRVQGLYNYFAQLEHSAKES